MTGKGAPETILWRDAVTGTVVMAALLRLACARGDLWLDEIWTLVMLSSVDSPLHVVTRLAHDNNHILNSLFAWGLRGFDGDFALRMPAVAAGTAAVALAAAFAGLPDGPGERDPSPAGVRAALAALLQAASYLMVHYQSEARGYALALGIGLVSPWAFLRAKGDPRSRLVIVHWVAASLALLGHAVAVHILVATAAWSLARFRRQGLAGASLLRAALRWHAVPAAAATVLYVGFLRRMVIGGGPETSPAEVLGRVAAYALGFPISLGTVTLVALGALLLAAGLVTLVRIGSDQWVFYATGILLSPLAAFFVQPGDLHFERYFYVSAALGLLLVARMLAIVATRSPDAAAVVVVLFLAAQVPRVHRLVADGRGQYGEALAYMVGGTPTRPVRVASDHDFRNGLVLSYCAKRLGLQREMRYVSSQDLSAAAADWFVVHRPAEAPVPPAGFLDPAGRAYRLEKSLPSAPLSGFTWHLFRRQGP